MKSPLMPQVGGVALLLAVGWGRGLSAQAAGTIQATARVVAVAPSVRTLASGIRMVKVEPTRFERRRRRDMPGATIFLDTPLGSTAAAPARRITIVHW